MKIIDNISSSHFEHIQEILCNADSLYIVSPFLMESEKSYIEFFGILNQHNIKSLHLTTTLQDNNPDLLKKVNALYNFCFHCMANNISYKIQIDNKLHGKIYIAQKNELPIRGVITSANFTEAGLKSNHEWGVLFEDQQQLKKVIEDVNDGSLLLNETQIHNIIQEIDGYIKSQQKLEVPMIDLKVSHHYQKEIQKRSENNEKKYFIKPIGWSEEHFGIDRKLSSNIEKLHFSQKPTAVEIGDIMICYGVGTTKLLGYFEVISSPVYLENDSRWPWEVEGKNLFPSYSENWVNYNNTISSIQQSFAAESPLTFRGHSTLGALRFGKDKIRLNENFARHIISVIES